MRWAAFHEYTADPERVQAARPAHRAYLTALLDAGQLAYAPMPGRSRTGPGR